VPTPRLCAYEVQTRECVYCSGLSGSRPRGRPAAGAAVRGRGECARMAGRRRRQQGRLELRAGHPDAGRSLPAARHAAGAARARALPAATLWRRRVWLSRAGHACIRCRPPASSWRLPACMRLGQRCLASARPRLGQGLCGVCRETHGTMRSCHGMKLGGAYAGRVHAAARPGPA